MGIGKSGIFRCVKREGGGTNELIMPKHTMRAPGNVPYIVDNLWEWKRPEQFPNRRYSVFASPTPDLAESAVDGGGTVYRVEFRGRYNLCQVIGYEDSKMHPDCRSLKKTMLRKLGSKWTDGKLVDKQKAGALWIPCLSKEDVDTLFKQVEELKNIRDEIWNVITYWKEVQAVDISKGIPDRRGELFFEPIDGYHLRPMET